MTGHQAAPVTPTLTVLSESPANRTELENRVMYGWVTIQPQSAKGAKIKTTGNCMGDQKDKTFDVYDAFLGVLQLAMIVVFFFLIRSTTLPHPVKILFASGLSAIFLTRWTTKRSRPWWIFARHLWSPPSRVMYGQRCCFNSEGAVQAD